MWLTVRSLNFAVGLEMIDVSPVPGNVIEKKTVKMAQTNITLAHRQFVAQESSNVQITTARGPFWFVIKMTTVETAVMKEIAERIVTHISLDATILNVAYRIVREFHFHCG